MTERTLQGVIVSSAVVAATCVLGLALQMLLTRGGEVTFGGVEFMGFLFIAGWSIALVPALVVAFATRSILSTRPRPALGAILLVTTALGGAGLPLFFKVSFGSSDLWKMEVFLGAIAGLVGGVCFWAIAVTGRDRITAQRVL